MLFGLAFISIIIICGISIASKTVLPDPNDYLNDLLDLLAAYSSIVPQTTQGNLNVMSSLDFVRTHFEAGFQYIDIPAMRKCIPFLSEEEKVVLVNYISTLITNHTLVTTGMTNDTEAAQILFEEVQTQIHRQVFPSYTPKYGWKSALCIGVATALVFVLPAVISN